MAQNTDTLDKDLVDTLSPEERAAINDGEPAADLEALQKLAGQAEDDPDDEGDDDADEKGEADAAPVEGKGAADDAEKAVDAAPAEAKAADPEPAPQVEDVAQRPRPYEYALPEGFDERVKGNKEAIADLRRRRDDGDLSMDEYDAEFDKLTDERDELNRMRARHETSVDQVRQYQQEQLNAAWSSTLKSAQADGIDYTKDAEKHGDFDGFIKALAARPENNDKPLTWFFDEAHRRVMALHGLQAKSGKHPNTSNTPPRNAKEAAAEARRPDLGAAPKDLSQVPGGQGAGDAGGDEFEDIDSLDGLAYEDAIAAKMKRDAGFDQKFTSRVRGNARAMH